MNTYEFIQTFKISFRKLRKGKIKNKVNLSLESGFSWPTIHRVFKEFSENAPLNMKSKNEFTINPNYEYFAGVYISEKSIEMSIIDFSGKEVFFKRYEFNDEGTFDKQLENLFEQQKNIRAITFCSDNCQWMFGDVRMTNSIWLKPYLTKQHTSKDTKVYYEKTCVTNTWKWYEDYENESNQLNLIVSFTQDNTYLIIMNKGQIIQVRKFVYINEESEDFYRNILFHACHIVNPNNIIFVPSSKKSYNTLKKLVAEWEEKICYKSVEWNQGVVSTTHPMKFILVEHVHFSETAAIHAMYRYYGWMNESFCTIKDEQVKK